MAPLTSTPPETLARAIEEFIAASPDSIVVEDGEVAFEFSSAKYSISTDHAKCVLHLWSPERNLVRKVLSAESKPALLRLKVQKFGQSKPIEIEICSERDRRSAGAKRSVRSSYQRLLQRVLTNAFPDYKTAKISSAADLEHSFGPAFTRAVLRKGRTEIAVIGVNAQEMQSTIDGALTAGLLWLQLCREKADARVVEGITFVLPRDRSATIRARMAHLDHMSAKFHLYELDEADAKLRELDTLDSGNVTTRLSQAPDISAAQERFSDTSKRIRSLVPGSEAVVLNSTEIAYRLHGLEFARARLGPASGSFRHQQEVVYGAGAYETALTPESEGQFVEFMERVVSSRRASGNKNDALFRMQPEKWLESLIMRDVSALDSRLDPDFVYSQVPAFAASDRGMIDVLTCTRKGRLVVIELKASEDLHLPLQGLDYWSRVNWHHQRREFQRFGYFAGRELSDESPLLYLVSPALQVHPATDKLLRFLSPKIECTVIGIDERWRDGVRVLFRKSSARR